MAETNITIKEGAEKAVADIQRDIEDIPGTTIISAADLEAVSAMGLLGFGKNKDSNIILIPQPSSDPNDPLNWSRVRKEVHFSILLLYTLLTAGFSNWKTSLYPQLEKVYNVTYTEINNASAMTFLFLAFGCWFFQPLSMKIGRRPVYLFQTLCSIFSYVVLDKCVKVGGLYGSFILTGISCAAIDSLVQISITDIFFLHEHATRMGLYLCALAGGSYLGPWVAPLVYESKGNSLNWCYYTCICMGSILLLIEFLFLEESVYKRRENPSSEITKEQMLTIALSNLENNTSTGIEPTELANVISRTIDIQTSKVEYSKVSELVMNNESSLSGTSLDSSKKPKTFLEKMKLLSLDQGSDKSFFQLSCVFPASTLAYPSVIWGGVAYGIGICWFMLIGLTEALFFSAPPYSFSNSQIGNTNFAPFVGAVLAAIYGYYTDVFQLFMSRRNNGIFEPEFRLWCLIPPVIINAVGLIMYGIGVNNYVHWGVPIVGMGFIGFGSSACFGIIMVYVVECYLLQALETMVTVLVFRNLLAMLFTFVLSHWLEGIGLVSTTWMLFMFCVLLNGIGLIFIPFGKRIRRMTGARYTKIINSRK